MVKTRRGTKHFPYTKKGVKDARAYEKKNRNTVQQTRRYA